MSDLIKGAAKALCEDAGWKWGEQSLLRDRYRRRARVVFSHLDDLGYAVVPKDPTPGMVEAGLGAVDENCALGGVDMEDAFRAMIDAALEGK